MFNEEDGQSIDLDQMEKWLENYFLDPLTSHFDQTQFRIDLYETDENWIVEALLSDYTSCDIKVFAENKTLIISAVKLPQLSNQDLQKRVRIIKFPFLVIDQKITATFQNGILEIFISKKEKVVRKNRFITLP
ncbi:Hsp20/alpha crystallin family protein [Neobacillus sp. PS3-40]|uniref:Hsp20/alpha crystallin family protein n=1 Tax=Neobacillus sp. PS3-40 TaxID=3070679 RepID=UPI0027E169CB|nr:Hsp20/alpha crystallin family protein [Neobacillus sp. PS3-40]WML44476.1 Hsp20/alpha crystallin family protein [Neobacillus sp. PS3-40]